MRINEMLDAPPSRQPADRTSIASEDPYGNLPVVCVQGLGFVGAAVAVAIARARDDLDRLRYRVIGVDLPTPVGLQRIASLRDGVFPFPTTDMALEHEAAAA